jgi:hypothetical protein
MNTNSNDSPENIIKIKPTGNRNKAIHKSLKSLFLPILNTLRKIKRSIPIRRDSRVHGVSPLSTNQNPFFNKGGKNKKRKTRKNRKTKRKQ